MSEEPVDYNAAIQEAEGILWWDMVEVNGALSLPTLNAAAALQAGQSITCEMTDFPEATRAEHIQNYSKPNGHGLTLAASPAIVRVVRNNAGKLSALIGYQAG